MNSVRWEAEHARGITLRDLDHEEVRRMCKLSMKSRWSGAYLPNSLAPALDSLHLRRHGKILQAAVVLFGKAPWRRYPQCALSTSVHGFQSKERNVERRLVRGPLLRLLAEAESFVDQHLNAKGECKLVLQEAISEIIINALVHRDYAIRDGHVDISIYPDRIEIRSPGGLPEKMTPAILAGPHMAFPRNPLIANAMARTSLMISFGRGTELAIRNCTWVGFGSPTFADLGDEVVVTFKLRGVAKTPRSVPRRRSTSVSATSRVG